MKIRYLFAVCLLASCDTAQYITHEETKYTTTWDQKDGVVTKGFRCSYEGTWDTAPLKSKDKSGQKPKARRKEDELSPKQTEGYLNQP